MANLVVERLMYRPEGFKYPDRVGTDNMAYRDAFNAGADALLDGLKKQAIGTGGRIEHWDNDMDINGCLFSDGWLVFIPETH